MQFMSVLWKLNNVFTVTPSMGGVYNVLHAYQVRGIVPVVYLMISFDPENSTNSLYSRRACTTGEETEA